LGRMYRAVVVSANGRSEMTVAFVDTGADETIISDRIAKRLKLKLHGEYKALSASRHKIVGKLASVKLSDSVISDKMVVGVTDEPFGTDYVDEEGVEVILGIDFLQRNNIKLDFAKS